MLCAGRYPRARGERRSRGRGVLDSDSPFSQMTTRTLRRDALAIFHASLAAADPAGAVERHLARRSYERFRNIYVIGAGKAGAAMARAAERVLGRHITGGLINVKDGHIAKLRRIELN